VLLPLAAVAAGYWTGSVGGQRLSAWDARVVQIGKIGAQQTIARCAQPFAEFPLLARLVDALASRALFIFGFAPTDR
jgi:hypothetical protein